jgi:hypothetical protein
MQAPAIDHDLYPGTSMGADASKPGRGTAALPTKNTNPGRHPMTMTQTAAAFFDTIETGKGWAACAPFCTPDASFSCHLLHGSLRSDD